MKNLPPFDPEEVFNIIHNLVELEATTWQTIVSAIKKEMIIDDWMKVRGVLQYLINHEYIYRTDDTSIEEYNIIEY